jgi:uncharacterized protein (TIGR02466 family)
MVDYAELCRDLPAVAEDDEAGQEWCEANGYPGYTSYASLDDLPWRMPIFGDLEKALDKHVAAFCKELGFDLGDKKLKCNSLWINILPEGGTHASHIHPHSVISGTTYVAMPEGTSALKLEDPRLPMMMLAPVPLKTAPQELQRFVYVKPAVGEVLLWESWLRHEVPMNMSEEERISVSFNYGWDSRNCGSTVPAAQNRLPSHSGETIRLKSLGRKPIRDSGATRNRRFVIDPPGHR